MAPGPNVQCPCWCRVGEIDARRERRSMVVGLPYGVQNGILNQSHPPTFSNVGLQLIAPISTKLQCSAPPSHSHTHRCWIHVYILVEVRLHLPQVNFPVHAKSFALRQVFCPACLWSTCLLSMLLPYVFCLVKISPSLRPRLHAIS